MSDKLGVVRRIGLGPPVAGACGHAVVLLVLGPLMRKSWHQAYNWVFIAAIIFSAAWLVAALFTGSSSLAPLFGGPDRAPRHRDKPGDAG